MANRQINPKRKIRTLNNNKKEVMLISNLLSPKIDYVFKRIFGYVGNEEITKDLLKSIINEEITDIQLDCNPITPKEITDEKVGILDIKAKINNTINCNIEMQVVDESNIEKRILYYWSKMYVNSIKAGMDYSKLEKCILILFTDYDIKNLKNIEKYITKWNIREEEFSKIILTDVLEICIIELSKFNRLVNKESRRDKVLNIWLNFMNNPEVVLKMENKAVKQARNVLEKISKDEHERYLAELREKHIMDQKAIRDAGFEDGFEQGEAKSKAEHEKYIAELREKHIMDQKAIRDAGYENGFEAGREDGLNQGIKEGIEKGIKESKVEMAKKLKYAEVDISIICKVTELTEEEIRKL